MALLIIFGFVAGAATAVSPCVLPVLPIALSAGVTGGRRRPLGVVTGLALSFTFATVALVYVIAALKLPDSLLRTVAIIALIGFGMSLLVPPVSDRLEALLSRVTGRTRMLATAHGGRDRTIGAANEQESTAQSAGGREGRSAGGREGRSAGGRDGQSEGRRQGLRRGHTEGHSGFFSGLLVGGGLGFLYAPCAGPILAGVITVSASQTFGAGRLAVALAYSIGSALVLYALMLGGRRLTSKLSRRSKGFQAATGAVMVLVALAMLANYDMKFETAIASDLPSALIDPAQRLETSKAAAAGLNGLRDRPARKQAGIGAADAGMKLPVLGVAPEFEDTEDWFNTPSDKPLSLSSLRGQVVLVDFWTYSCINCLRTLPYLNAWYRKYHRDGFTIVGVHTPEFPFEHSAANVAEAIRENHIRYPVVQDNDYATWDAYQNEYWPAEYLIDAQRRIRLADFGEGEYAAKQRAIRSLLREAGTSDLGKAADVNAQRASANETTPESYLGAERAERFLNGPIEEGLHDYGPPGLLEREALRYSGTWRISAHAATAVSDAKLQLSFDAKRVFLVLGSSGKARNVRLLLNGKPIPPRYAGADVRASRVRVSFQRLYKLVSLPKVERRVLTVEFERGVSGYAFTFG